MKTPIHLFKRHKVFQSSSLKILFLKIPCFSTLTTTLVFGLVLSGCQTLHHKEPDRLRSVEGFIATTSVVRPHSQAGAELIPAAFLAGLDVKKQDLTLLSYSADGDSCNPVNTNEVTTDTDKPFGCEACQAQQPAQRVPEKALQIFTPLRSSKKKWLPTQRIAPVVGVKNIPVDRLSSKGRYVSSRSGEPYFDNHLSVQSSACVGPKGECGLIPNSRLAMGDATESWATDVPLLIPQPSKTTQLAHYIHGGAPKPPLPPGVSQAGSGPLVSLIADAMGRPIKKFPATVALTAGMGRAFFSLSATTPNSIGETVYSAILRNHQGKKEVPLWQIRLIAGKQLGGNGFLVEVESANTIRWKQNNRQLSDEQLSAWLSKNIQASMSTQGMSANGGDINVELIPSQTGYLPISYELYLESDADLYESVQTTVIDKDLSKDDC